jgi:hypothetical protein
MRCHAWARAIQQLGRHCLGTAWQLGFGRFDTPRLVRDATEATRPVPSGWMTAATDTSANA